MKRTGKGKGDGFDLSGGAVELDVDDFLSGGRVPFGKLMALETAAAVATASESVEAETSSTTPAGMVWRKTSAKDYENGDPWTARTILLRQNIVGRLEKVAKAEDIKVSQLIRAYISRGLKRAEKR